ncbi:hypothetical protein BGW38_005122 [Lunasporangiospora selenospora]|uniref:Uncharacterized protein n=1 Tax=Lunasporangiospora selenospora TaxID=979761 RepID=A0A9P6G0G1_9FUNG|nr:hypothetical protein BGW38_005122 [Lunasporangiospora selenospora]
MKFSHTTLFLLCLLVFLVAAPHSVNSQVAGGGGGGGGGGKGGGGGGGGGGADGDADGGDKETSSTGTRTATVSKETISTPLSTTTAAATSTKTQQTPNTPKPTQTSSISRSLTHLPTSTTSQGVLPTNNPVPPTNNGTCTSSTQCPQGQLCAFPAANSPATCQTVPSLLCEASPSVRCTTSAECTSIEYSYCATDNTGSFCVGIGTPGTATECKKNKGSADNSGLSSTIKYAGIGVGAVAALGMAFALVRWQRRRQRTKRAADMFSEIDYGMTDRTPKVALSQDQGYSFAARENAHGSEPSGYDNNHYGDNGYNQGYGNNNYYDNQQNGYGGGGGNGGGYYDNQGYDDYQHQQYPQAVARGMSTRRAYGPGGGPGEYHADQYGAEPSEVGYGHRQNGHGAGHGGHGGYGGQY